MPKRLPSRRWAIAHSRERAPPFEDSLPDVAFRPVRRSLLESQRAGEVGRTTSSTRTKEIRVYAAWLYIPLIENNRRMARTQWRSLGKKDGKRIDSVLDDRLRLLAVGRLDRKSRDKLLIELARNPEWVDRLAQHLHALSPL